MRLWHRRYTYLLLIGIELSYPTISYPIPANLIQIPSTAIPSRIQPLGTDASMLLQAPAVEHKDAESNREEHNLNHAAEVFFVLKKIKITGNHVFNQKQLRPLYKNKLNKKISLQSLLNITEEISDFYRHQGYLVSRAILPPQTIEDGIVTIRIIEGYINKARVTGNPNGVRNLVQAFGNHICQHRPAHLRYLEQFIRLANQIPATSVKSVLQPSKSALGASDILLYTENTPISGLISYDNFGTRYIGPEQTTVYLALNSKILAGDQFAVSGTASKDLQALRSTNITYDMPVGTYGSRMSFGGNYTETRPAFVLTPLELIGRAQSSYISLQYPLLSSLTERLNITSTFNYMNTGTDSALGEIYYDRIRYIQIGTTYELQDKYVGSNLLQLNFSKGLNILGANRASKILVSRAGGTADFNKINFQYARLQIINPRFSVYLYSTGQYALNPLLVSLQYGFGGSQLGRAYDPSEIIGDNGIAGSIEVRFNTMPGLQLLKNVQYYTFYDIGKTWNKLIVNQLQNQSAASLGAGARFQFTNYFSGNLYIAQPLTKGVAAEAILKNGQKPRIFFSFNLNPA